MRREKSEEGGENRTSCDSLCGTGKAESPTTRDLDVTHSCAVLYLHATHEFIQIRAPLAGY